MMKKLCVVLMICALSALPGGCHGAEPDLSEYASGPAEVPLEILGQLDEETKEALLGDPKYVALTFDDGPRTGTTDRLLDGLLERGAAATFFVIGEQVPNHAELLRRMKDEGHQIGNHTYSHVRLLKMDKDAVVEEVHKAEVSLEAAVGQGTFWLRPPYGGIDADRAASIHTPMIYWSVDPQDWKLLDTGKVVEAVVGDVEPGDIILLHDFYPTSVDAALEIIDRLQREGYRFVTVEELFRIYGVQPQAGTLYASPTKVRPLP